MKYTGRNFLLFIILFLMAFNASVDEAALKNPDGTWKWTNQFNLNLVMRR